MLYRGLTSDNEVLVQTNESLTKDISYWRDRLHTLVSRYNDVDPEEHRIIQEEKLDLQTKVTNLTNDITNLKESFEKEKQASLDVATSKEKELGSLKAAYDNLDKLLSSESINKMTADTQRLAEKQQVLMGNIEKLVPFIGKAENLLKGMNSDKMGGMLEKMQEQMANLSNKAK